CGEHTGVELARLNQWIVFWRRIDICADSSDCSLVRIKARNTKVSDFYSFLVSGQQEVLWLDVAMNDAAFVCVGQAGTNLLKIEHRTRERQRMVTRQRRHVASR